LIPQQQQQQQQQPTQEHKKICKILHEWKGYFIKLKNIKTQVDAINNCQK